MIHIIHIITSISLIYGHSHTFLLLFFNFHKSSDHATVPRCRMIAIVKSAKDFFFFNFLGHINEDLSL